MLGFFLCILLQGAAGAKQLTDGKTKSGRISSLIGGSNDYKFHVGHPIAGADMRISLTAYSDWSDPDLYVKMGESAGRHHYDWKSTAWGSDFITISESEIQGETDYYILVRCSTYCRYYITVSYEKGVELIPGIELVEQLKADYEHEYNFLVTNTTSELTVSAFPISGEIDMYVKNETHDFSDQVLKSWTNGKYFSITNITEGQLFNITILAKRDCKYSIVASEGYDTVTMLRASSPIGGLVDTDKMRYYEIPIDNEDANLTIQCTRFSGEPRVYVRCSEKPTTENYDYKQEDFAETIEVSSSSRESQNCSTGDIFIGVFGKESASYMLSASISDTAFIEIVPGLPQTGVVSNDRFQHYRLPIIDINRNMNISLYLAPQSGNPDLYAKLCLFSNETNCLFDQTQIENPHDFNIMFSKHGIGAESLMFQHLAESCNSTCNYVIGVYGSSMDRSTYSLTATENLSEEVILRDGTPMGISLGSDSYAYYKYTVHNITVTDLTFSLSPLAGAPELYVSQSRTPTNEVFDKKGTENIVKYTRGIDSDSLLGDYHIAVYSKSASTFSIIANEKRPSSNSTIHLYPGHPQQDMLYNTTEGNYRIFYFTVEFTEETKQDLRIALTPFTGRFELYATNSPLNLDWTTDTFYYDWKDSSNSTDPENVINIRTDDPFYRLNSTYLVVAQAVDFSADKTAKYSITYTVGNGIILLTEDVPYNDQILLGDYNYYFIPIYHTHVQISVTAISGNPDLYLSLSANNTHPSKEKWDFKSSGFGSEILTLHPEDIHKYCSDVPEQQTSNDNIACEAYIAVYGFSMAHYAINVHPVNDLPQPLILGNPQSGFINGTSYDYYYANANLESDFTLNLQPVSGDPDLYVLLRDSTPLDIEDWEKPSNSSFDFASHISNRAEALTIPKATLTETCPSGECLVLVSVHCTSVNCQYVLTANQLDQLVLSENEPLYGFVKAHEYVYYQYYCNVKDNDLVITATSLNGGDVDLYVDKGRDKRPDEENNTWNSEMFHNDTVVITGDNLIGTYIIAVYGEEVDTSYVINVNNHPSAILKLGQGVPYAYSLPANSSVYFYYYNTLESDILISLSPRVGSALMAVNRARGNDEASVYRNLPTLTDNMWNASSTNDQNIIKIKTNDEHFCELCEFIIGVFTKDTACEFSITANNNIHPQTLQNGIPVKGQLEQDEIAYYTFEVLLAVDFDVILDAYSGDPDLYVSRYKMNEDYSWQSVDSTYVDHVKIKVEDENYIVGTYLIVVRGYKSSSYSLVAHTKDYYIKMVSGWPLSYSLGKDEHVYFKYQGSAECKLRPLSDYYHPVVYVNYEKRGSNIPMPSSSYFDESFSTYDNIYSSIFFNLEDRESLGRYNIGVFSNVTGPVDDSFSGEFELTCSNDMQIAILETNKHQYQEFEKDREYRKYEINLPTSGHLEIEVEPCAGKLELLIYEDWTTNEPVVSTSELTKGVLRGIVPNAKQGKYYILVKILQETDIYEIGASFDITSIFDEDVTKISGRLVPGNNGVMELSRDDKKIDLSWQEIEYSDYRSYIHQEKVEYMVYTSKSKDVSFLSACGVFMAERYGRAELQSMGFNMTHSKFAYHSEGEVNVVAAVHNSSHNGRKLVAYTPILVKEEKHGPKNGIGFIILWVVASLFAIAVVTAVCFWQKYKRTKRRLEYEMSDVRVIAAGVSSGQIDADRLSAKRAPYAALSEQKAN